MRTSAKFCINLYAIALHFYPNAFYQRYAEEMLEAASREIAQSRNLPRLTVSLLWDTLRSLPRAHWNYSKPGNPILLTAGLAIYSALLLFFVISNQRDLRHIADYMPGQFTREYSQAVTDPTCATYAPGCTAWYARVLSSVRPQEISSPSWLNSGFAFVAIYDSAGHALGGDARLNGKLPQPPLGIFDTIRQRGEFRGTWQPQPGIRVAFTGRPLPSGGFVLSGDSLAQSEAAQQRFLRGLLPGWLIWLVFTMRLLHALQKRMATH